MPKKSGESDEAAPISEPGVVLPFPRMAVDLAAPDRRSHLAALFHSHQKRLVRFLAIRLGSMAEAQDAAQEAYVRLLQQDTARVDDNLQALLYVTARNIAIDRQRQRNRYSAKSEESWSDLDVPSAERVVSGQQQLDRLAKLIDELPPKCRDAFIAYKFYDMSYPEIAQRMDLTESMVRKYVLRAIAYCSSHLDRQEDAT